MQTDALIFLQCTDEYLADLQRMGRCYGRSWWTEHKDRLGKASSRGTAAGGDPSDIRTAIGELTREKDTG